MAMTQVSLRYSRDVVPVHGPVPEAYQICRDWKGAYRLMYMSSIAPQYVRLLRHSGLEPNCVGALAGKHPSCGTDRHSHRR